MNADLTWREVTPNFGTAHEFGCCNAAIGSTICGWPRRADGTCRNGHPAEPHWVAPTRPEADR